MIGRKKILRRDIKKVMKGSLYNLLYQEVDQSPVAPELKLELKVLKTSLIFSQIQNADLVVIVKLSKQTTSDVPRNQLLSTNLRNHKLKISPVYYARTPYLMPDMKLLL
jgi:hypothetical protein